MLEDKKIIVVLPAYQAGTTLRMTYELLSHEVVDDVILVDDGSTDDTVEVAYQLGIKTILHSTNMGMVRTKRHVTNIPLKWVRIVGLCCTRTTSMNPVW